MYLREGSRLFVFASKAGALPTPRSSPARPSEVTVEIDDQTSTAIAKQVTGAERDRIYARWEATYPQFREYQEKTTRIIPVIELEPQA